MDPSDPAVLYAATATGLFKSRDGTGSWNRLPTGEGQCRVVSVDPTSPYTIYAICAKDGAVPPLRLQRSDDGGTTWVDLSNAGSPKINGYFAFLWFDATSSPSTVYKWGYRSTDRGDTWTRLSAAEQRKAEALQKTPRPMPAAARKALAAFRASSGPYWRVTDAVTGAKVSVNFDATKVPIVDPNHPSTFYVATREGVYKSRDGGKTWRRASTGLLTDLTVVVVGAELAAGDASLGVGCAGVRERVGAGAGCRFHPIIEKGASPWSCRS